MSSGNIVIRRERFAFLLLTMSQIFELNPLRNGCSSYFSPTAWFCSEQVVAEDISDLLSVEGNNGSMFDFDMSDGFDFSLSDEGSSDSSKSVTWCDWLSKFDVDGTYTFERDPSLVDKDVLTTVVVDEALSGSSVEKFDWQTMIVDSSSYMWDPSDAVAENVKVDTSQMVSEVENEILEPIVPVVVYEPWENIGWLSREIRPGTWGASFSCALWYMYGKNCGGCQECKVTCRYWWGKCVERGWDSLIWDTTAR
jgi:hypothetical protein